MQTISYTEVNSYRRCPKSWEYKYKQGLKRKRKGIRLLRGSILHEMLDAYVERKIHGLKYEGPDPWDVLEGYAEEYGSYFEEEKELHGDIVGDCGKIFEGYLRKYRRDPLKYEESELGIELYRQDRSRSAKASLDHGPQVRQDHPDCRRPLQ
jgi:hypothetical protein